MTDNTDIIYAQMSDKALMAQIGGYVKSKRLEQNRTQKEVSIAASISRSTLSLLERGETVTITTFIQVMRVLNILEFMDYFKVSTRISPIALAKLERNKRKRARSNAKQDSEQNDWQ